MLLVSRGGDYGFYHFALVPGGQPELTVYTGNLLSLTRVSPVCFSSLEAATTTCRFLGPAILFSLPPR